MYTQDLEIQIERVTKTIGSPRVILCLKFKNSVAYKEFYSVIAYNRSYFRVKIAELVNIYSDEGN